MSKTLILIRHAHRDSSDPSLDNGLSEKGRDQVERLVEFLHRFLHRDLKRELEDAKPVFLSSPKKRCRETLGPVAAREHREIEVDPRLSEVSPIESAHDFEERVSGFIDDWKYDGAPLTIACSHGDWIPVLVQRLTGARIGIRKSGVVVLESVGGEIFLTNLIQKPF